MNHPAYKQKHKHKPNLMGLLIKVVCEFGWLYDAQNARDRSGLYATKTECYSFDVKGQCNAPIFCFVGIESDIFFNRRTLFRILFFSSRRYSNVVYILQPRSINSRILLNSKIIFKKMFEISPEKILKR